MLKQSRVAEKSKFNVRQRLTEIEFTIVFANVANETCIFFHYLPGYRQRCHKDCEDQKNVHNCNPIPRDAYGKHLHCAIYPLLMEPFQVLMNLYVFRVAKLITRRGFKITIIKTFFCQVPSNSMQIVCCDAHGLTLKKFTGSTTVKSSK